MADKEDKAEGGRPTRRTRQGREGEAGEGKARGRPRGRGARERRSPPRLQQAFRRGRAPEADRAVRLQERDAGAAHRQDRAQHGRRRSASPTARRSSSAADDLAHDRRPEGRSITQARKSIATFKLREDMPIGVQGDAAQARACTSSSTAWSPSRCRACATSAASTRRASTAAATTRIGIKEHIIFPEIDYDKVDQVWGMDIIVCTTAKTDDEARALLEGFQLPVPAVSGRRSNAEARRQMAKKSSIEKNNRRRKAGRSSTPAKRAR